MTMPSDDEGDLEAALLADIEKELDGPAKEAPEGETAEEKEERLYRRDGRRFVAKEADKEEPAAKEPAKAAKDGETPAPEGEAKPAKQAWKPLWYKDEFGDWNALSEPLRKALEQREKEAAQGIEKHATAAKAWEPLNEALKPFEQQLRAQGQSPQQFVGGLINIYGYLQSNPVEALDWLAQNTLGQGWTLREVARWMDEQGHDGHKADPVQQELSALKQQIAALQSAPQQQYQQSVSQTISKWSEDKPYFADLQSTIYGLIQADPSVRDRFRVDAKATLDSLYEQAQWAHPQIRERILKEKEDQRVEEAKRARAAGAQSPRAGADNGQARLPKQKGKWDIEADLRETFDELGLN